MAKNYIQQLELTKTRKEALAKATAAAARNPGSCMGNSLQNSPILKGKGAPPSPAAQANLISSLRAGGSNQLQLALLQAGPWGAPSTLIRVAGDDESKALLRAILSQQDNEKGPTGENGQKKQEQLATSKPKNSMGSAQAYKLLKQSAMLQEKLQQQDALVLQLLGTERQEPPQLNQTPAVPNPAGQDPTLQQILEQQEQMLKELQKQDMQKLGGEDAEEKKHQAVSEYPVHQPPVQLDKPPVQPAVTAVSPPATIPTVEQPVHPPPAQLDATPVQPAGATVAPLAATTAADTTFDGAFGCLTPEQENVILRQLFLSQLSPTSHQEQTAQSGPPKA